MDQPFNFSDYKNRKQHRRVQRWIAGFLACVVGFSVTSALVRPASTMERSCAIEEHTHTDECYVTVLGALDCGLEAREPHAHGENCYLPLIVCVPEDPDAHIHEDCCYESTLVCLLEKTEGHIHTEDCHIPLENLTCTEDTQTQVLVCGLPEIVLHTHTDACFTVQDAERVLTCPLTEVLRHDHDESCLTVTTVPADVQVLTCTITEHTHTDQCRQAQTEPSETEAPIQTEPTETQSQETQPQETQSQETLPQKTQSQETQPQASLFALRPTTTVGSGTFLSTEGNELHWEMIQHTLTAEHTLTISGSGTMPAFEQGTAPWYKEFNATPAALVLGDELLNVSSYAFWSMYITSIDWGEKINSIDRLAFFQCKGITSLSIPGSVETVGYRAFYMTGSIGSLTLAEGVRIIEDSAFHQSTGTACFANVHIPASVESIGDSSFGRCEGYSVDPNSRHFRALDGVLYNYDITTLVDYPHMRVAETYSIPNTVSTVAPGALSGVQHVQTLYIPASVQHTPRNFCQQARYYKVYVEDGAMLGESGTIWSAFYASSLTELRLPDNIPYSFGDTFSFCTALRHLEIPAGTAHIATPGSYITNLETLRYNARNAGMQDRGMLEESTFHLTIGKDVDWLSYVFHEFTGKARSIRFEGSNYITIEEGVQDQAFQDAPAPFQGLSGSIYIDAQGVVYTLDEETRTAGVFCVQPGTASVVIPGFIKAETGDDLYTVTSIRTDALKYAGNLRSISFSNPEAITDLQALALANCPDLTQVCGQTTVEGASALFPNAALGYNLFYNTGLIGAPENTNFDREMDGSQELTVTGQDATALEISAFSEYLNWAGKENLSGGYRMLTGQTVTFTASVGNTEENQQNRYRIYFRSTNSDITLSMTPGTGEDFSGWSVEYCATEDPYTVYMEFGTPPEGNTSGIPVIANYPNGTSAGGGLTLWGVIVEADADPGILEPEDPINTIQVWWTTAPDDFVVTTAPTPASTMGVISDNAGGAKPSANLSWQVNLTRSTENTSSWGKDYAQQAQFADTFTLPKGIQWHPEVLAALEEAPITAIGSILYAGKIPVADITLSGSNLALYDRSMVIEEDHATFRWLISNLKAGTEMNPATVTVRVYASALQINTQTFDTTSPVDFRNEATATVGYTHRDAAAYEVDPETGAVTNPNLYASATRSISGGAGTISIQTTASDAQYFGEDVTYTNRIYNQGALPWTGDTVSDTAGYTLRNMLPGEAWIKPENMERMFEESPSLKITITDAVLGAWETVHGVDGSAVNLHPGNSDTGTTGHTLTITRSADVYQVAAEDGSIYTAESLSQALQAAGYAVTASAKYTCVWQLSEPGTPFILTSGENRYFHIYATVKDTCLLISTDWQGEYNFAKKLNLTNILYVFRPNAQDHNFYIHYSLGKSFIRDAVISKTVYRNGQALEAEQSYNHGDVLKYRLTFTHYGSGTPQDLPFVDYLFGSQYLLVPADLNPDLAGLQRHGEYYILTEGDYSNVVAGQNEDGQPMTAAWVSVHPAKEGESLTLYGDTYYFTGMLTQIEWYYPQLPSGTYQTEISYQALVDLDLTGVDYTIGNVITLGCRPGSRLYNSIFSGGSLLDFTLDILETPGETQSDDILDEDGYTLIGPGEAVSYRAKITSSRPDTVILKGDKLAVSLPDTFGVFDWELGVNVTDLRIVTEDGVLLEGVENARIDKNYAGLQGDIQYILWPEGSSVTFTQPSSLYIYYTLTYPSQTQTYTRSASLWDQYTDALRGNPLDVDLYLYRYSASVRHDLREPGSVLLQKGVLGTYQYTFRNNVIPCASRLYYNNRDGKERAVSYYVLIYNGGNKRLYLNDLYDQLPEGFTFLTMANADGSIPISNHFTATCDGSALVNVADPEISFRSATVTADTDQGLTFRIGAGTGDNALRYDTQREQYYLERSEAIVFSYFCNVGLSSETRSKATNQISMPYTDDTGTGMGVLSQQDVPARAVQSPYFNDENDGTRISVTGQPLPGIPDTENETLLVSQVTMQRGGIVPGLTKFTESYQSDASIAAIPYVNQVPHNAIVNWRVRLHNSGTLAMTDYTLTDVMPYPYSFVGNVSCGLPEDGGALPYGLISIPKHTPAQGLILSVADITPYQPVYRDVVIGGEPVTFGQQGREFLVSLGIDQRGNEVLSIRFTGLSWSVTEGGYMDVALSGINTTGSYTYSVYTNQAYLLPSQEFSSVSQGSMVRDNAGQPVAARNADSVTVSIGYATSSKKSATQDDRTASSTGTDRNFIVLAEDDPNFSYALQVNNDTDRSMTKLVLIDNLPEIGDHNPFDTSTQRGSEFTVSLADEPNFRVMIVPENAEAYAATDYTVQFSTGTDFGGPQSVHWRGQTPGAEDPTQWTDDPTGARSIRIILRQAVPPKASVVVTFDAVAPNDLQPGQTAWSSFGYHYALEGQTVELEAMPPVVGVKAPSIPALSKKVLDINGNPIPLPEDAAFTFVICEGSLPGDAFTTAAELAQLLDAAGKAYRSFCLSMEAGSSISSQMDLTFDGWNWKEGQTYTLVEILEDDTFSFRKFLGTGASCYTFTYDPAVQQQILCENTLNHWSVELTKTDPTGKGLEDGVFGLYSPNAADQISGESFGAPDQITYNGITWYLSHIGITDESGCILWEQLERSSYYLLEIQPPPGHMMGDQPGRLLYRSAAENGVCQVTMVNEPGYALPRTGSIGTTPLTILGLLLMAAAAYVFLHKKKMPS